MKAAKFGGSSLADATQLRKVVEIIKADDTRRFAVVSAPGKRFATDKKVTDLLVELYHKRNKNEPIDSLITEIFEHYQEIGQSFQIEEEVLQQIYQSLLDLKDLAMEDNPHVF
ncbi:aspartokinase [Tetragenococcus muriaticus PMC-11-5]|uniref:Aspartokinase n=1 Tax=Tetragenococcus muriaticus PMC-11-5 TaxID=1302649 RepID=A0A091C850_9ENTE|nr:aspartokinase [Tetragenococcus muriaticus PMC-11-5]